MSELDTLLDDYLARFLEENKAARELGGLLNDAGVGLRPLIDHCTIRTLDVDRRARQFTTLGFRYDTKIGVLEFDTWWAKVYRKPGYPALFIDQAYTGARGEGSLIPEWVAAHGDECFHHIAVQVESIDHAIKSLEDRGHIFVGNIVGDPGTDLRQIFTQPEMKNNAVFTVLELIERHNGYAGFLPPQADGLMESTRMN